MQRWLDVGAHFTVKGINSQHNHNTNGQILTFSAVEHGAENRENVGGDGVHQVGPVGRVVKVVKCNLLSIADVQFQWYLDACENE